MDRVRVLVGLLSLGVVVSLACGSVAQGPAAITPSPDSTASSVLNVRGTIDRGTPRPCPTGEVCDAPLTALFVDFSQPGKPDVRTPVDGSGAFALHLDPGRYSISAAPPPMNGKLKPSEVVVPKTGSLVLNLVITYTAP
jgi:hypothetical protein